MNSFIASLSSVCRAHLLAEKWLIAPSLRVGHQWLQSVARAGQPVINAHVQTVKGMALELAAAEMAEKNLVLITSTASAFIVDAIWNRLPGVTSGYLSRLNRSPTLSQTVSATISAMRLAGLKSEVIEQGHFEVGAKGRDLVLLVHEYQKQLTSRNLVDYAGVLQMAIARLRSDLFAIAHDVRILIPKDAELVGLEKELFKAIRADHKCSLAVDQESAKDAESDRALLSWVLEPASAPASREDSTVTVFHAIGEANEAREVLRRCLASNMRLDEVEILHTDTATYVPLFYEIANRLQTDGTVLVEGVPITFAEGIPASYSRPGRALTMWQNWISNDYPQAVLVRMLNDGLLAVPGIDKSEFSFSGLAALLRPIGIGVGRDRYIAKLDEQLEAATRQLEILRSSNDDEEGGGVRRIRAVQRRQHGLGMLRDLSLKLLKISQPPATTSLEILDSATRFLTEIARHASEQDNYALDVLVRQIQEMKRWGTLVGEHGSLDLPSWLSTLPNQSRMLGSGPKPGHLHVAHVLSGGHSGRPHAFIMGLDDSRFPGPTLQDPILLDSERVGLSSELPTAAGRLRRILAHFARLLARLRGDVTLSFSSRSLGDDRETFPSNLLLSVFRIISGDRDGDQTALMQWLGAPASFAPDVPEKCLDECEWWLWRLCGREKVSNATELVLARFPHLARGLHAQTQRESQSFTAFDGHVPVAGADLNPHSVAGPPVSASMLETVGRCPLAYFFRHALRVRPLEELTVDQDRWLDALAFGSLLHEVFRRFMTELRDEGKLPDLNRDQERLQHTLRQEIAKYRDLYPPPNEGTYRDQCRQLERAAQIFLMDEHELCKTNVPMFMEASIGLPSDTATALDQAEPVIILVGNGESIRVRGRIDRIDRVGGENSSTFTIWDYKTGSSARYQKQDPFRQGRMIQHILYLAMAEAVLRRKVDPKAIVQSFGYFFPGARGWGQRIVWSPDEIRQGQPIVQRLCQSIARGAFLPTDNSDDCSFCDYRAVCGDFEAVTKCSKEKRSGTLIVELESFRALRANGKEQ